MADRMSDYCEIVVRGQLDPNWSEWFEGLAITHDDRDKTIILGPIRDQAALYGILTKMRVAAWGQVQRRRAAPSAACHCWPAYPTPGRARSRRARPFGGKLYA